MQQYTQIIFFVAIIAAFYFLIIRPQQKRQKEQAELMTDTGAGRRDPDHRRHLRHDRLGGRRSRAHRGRRRLRAGHREARDRTGHATAPEDTDDDRSTRPMPSRPARSPMRPLVPGRRRAGAPDADRRTARRRSTARMSDAARTVVPMQPPRVTLEVVQNDPELLAYIADGRRLPRRDRLHRARAAARQPDRPHRRQHPARGSATTERDGRGGRESPASCTTSATASRASDHWISSAFIARDALTRLGMPYAEVAHGHERGRQPRGGRFGPGDRRRGRRRHRRQGRRAPDARAQSSTRRAYDIHDRVNHAAKRSFLRVDSETRMLTLEIEIDTTRDPDHGVLRDLPGADAVVPPCRYSVGRGVLARDQRNKAPVAEEMTRSGQGRQENGPEATQLPVARALRDPRDRFVGAVRAPEQEDHAGPRHPGRPLGHPDGQAAARASRSPPPTWTARSSSCATASTSSAPRRRASSARAATRSSCRCPASRTPRRRSRSSARPASSSSSRSHRSPTPRPWRPCRTRRATTSRSRRAPTSRS